MIPPSFIRLAELRARDVLAEAERERLVDDVPRSDGSRIVVTAVLLAAIVVVLASALMLRSILILGGYGFT
jgi:hypothetical protein